MPFYEIIERMQILNYGYIVLVHVGAFFEAVGLDAYIMHELFGLKLTKYDKYTYKIGIPVGSLKKYVKKLDKINIPFCIYDKIENSQDIIYMNNILDNWYINNEENEIKEGKYDYIKVYDSNIEGIYENDINIEDSNKLKIVLNLLSAEKQRRKVREFVNVQNKKYIKDI